MSNRNPRLIKWAAERNLLPADESAIAADKEIHPCSRFRILTANQILAYISQFPGSDAKAIAKAVRLNTHTVQIHCLDLEDAGLICTQMLQTNGAPKRYYPI